jgi:hypothetical protein
MCQLVPVSSQQKLRQNDTEDLYLRPYPCDLLPCQDTAYEARKLWGWFKLAMRARCEHRRSISFTRQERLAV